MSIFKAYDIRGTYPDQINADNAFRIGAAMVKFLNAKRLVVGRDMRTMAPEIQDAVIEGMMSQGCDVVDIGLASTPMVYFAIGKIACDGGMAVTASHNPKQYIGFKMCRGEARPLSGDTGIKDIEQLVVAGDLAPAAAKGKREQVDLMDDWCKHIAGFAKGIRPMKICVDYANGMGANESPKIFAQIPGLEIVPMYDELDGTFPNHEANPLKESNLDVLREAVKRHGATMGLSFDGDADRCAFVDEDGRTVLADLITVILSRGFLERHPGKGIIYDLRSSKVLPEEVARLGGRPVRERVGHSFMKETMRKEDCIGGGELSGHFYFAENFYTDCGVLAAIEVLNQLSKEGRSLKTAADELRKYHGTGEVNFKVEDKAAMMKAVEARFSDGEIDFLDGITVTYPDWWANVRPSNTEPFLRMCLEADTPELLAEKRAALIEVLGNPVDH
ncbi:MAG: phosphomannomutase/phosphoglucomutase [Planctomycetota bacterium]|nr:phosphomannomutase/phosphoglucomutase [Planctomycetota bacterium]MEC9046684.1 phosphomannomutase/phosphoglucomutase [Planctomycetota bacterium]